MKKLFISCPMRGRKEEDIKKSMEKMHNIAEATLGEKLEVIPSFIDYQPPENVEKAIWYLGESIKKLAEADVVICVSDSWNWPGCRIERDAAAGYGIPLIETDIRYIAPDAIAAIREMERSVCCSPNA
ncbi:MAG: hypothetical protein IKP29_07715 [Pseudobutyrivibrio sp.]|nr:hypothetical protein [Pseudobutyrivibrio sp.]